MLINRSMERINNKARDVIRSTVAYRKVLGDSM